MDVDEQENRWTVKEKVEARERERGRRQSKETTNAQTHNIMDDMCMSDFARHTLRHLEPQCDVCTRSNMSRKKSRVRSI